ncbi:ATP-dependent helicase/deoxyribonuclease subunit B [Paenibacillus baekrokdamisoli]|uniref:ATP-dependent helicase/deoxyribonuclease subunit B n=1 Tax=Paenibacillus baekrokdamisoli TaxID=1712516 RepID=A0A3G9ISC2_9BACL|nr:helicase-exonuclease AddAB subunit AddB [Paenibacillus baekrokdamisoli]MBB3070291.1 ATP-dependent helicase/nuclease subunit B [Paenibacillus baekrokdamisoli]BBH21296.1 ATP-dependent helicase/deoxyribonuclease subunit B [Paenibacillus baekrokdamisoli]
MALRFVIGRSGAGKTHYCLDAIRQQALEQPDGAPMVMLVPEQATFQTEYALLGRTQLKGTIRAQALSFRRLSFRVMQETGGTALVPISENGKNMLLYKIVHRLENQLQLFQGSESQHGFIERLGDLMTEWKRYGIDSEQLHHFTQSSLPGASNPLLGRKLNDLQQIALELEKELAGLYVDAEDYLSWLVKGFGQAASMKQTQIWVDGFNGFTPKEFEALEVLIRDAADVTIALSLDRLYGLDERPHELDLFRPTAETFLKLRELALNNGVTILDPIMLNGNPHHRFRNSPMLAHVERHYADRKPLRLSDVELEKGSISLHAAANRRAEVEAVARDIVSRVRDEGLRYRDLALLVRNAPDYNDYITAVFNDYQIPFFLDQKKAALHHPFVEFIRSALEIATHGWHYESVFRCIKTELLIPEDGSLTRETFDLLENYALAAGINGNRWLTRSQWRPITRDTLEGDPAQASEREVRHFDVIMAAREAVVPILHKFNRELKKASTVRQMCEALYRLLMTIDAPDRLERWSRKAIASGDTLRAREHKQLWDGVMDVLDQLTEMTGEEPMTLELFSGMIETGLESLKLAAVPPSLDQVLIGSMDRTRSGHIRVCYVLGANDGIMPQRLQEDGVLTEQERETLENGGLAMAPSVRRRLLDERFLIYNALTTPSRHLWVSWPMSDEEGKSLHPSEVIRHVKQLFPGIPERMIAIEPLPTLTENEQQAFMAHPERTLSYLITQLRGWRQGMGMASIWWEAFNWYAVRPEWQGKLQRLVGSLDYSNEEPSLSIHVADMLYGKLLRGSVSRMERFVSCPFQHFAIHGLRLRERELYKLAAPDIGQLFHAALSRLTETLGERWGTLSPEEIKEASAEIVNELALRLQSQILFSSGRHQYVARKLKDIVGQAAIILGEHAKRSQFLPVGLEIGFGPDGPLPAVQIPLDGGRMLEMAGRIDRVDVAQSDDGLLLRVIDYKSSAKQLRLEEVAYGMALQMLTYLDVLLTNATEWLGQPAKAAGALYFHVHNPMLSSANGISPDKARMEMLKRFKLKGLVLADEGTVKMMDDSLSTGYSDLLPIGLKRDGGFYSSSSVVSDEQWGTLRQSVRATLRRIGDRIAGGDVSIAPYRLGGKTPCQFCAYKPVCQFDPLIEGNCYTKLHKPGKDEVWELLAAGEGSDHRVDIDEQIDKRKTGEKEGEE